MGLLGKIFAAKVASKVVDRMNRSQRDVPVRGPAQGQYIPANDAVLHPTMKTRANDLVHQAEGIYRRNPKLVTTVAGGLATILLASWAKKKHLI